MTTEIRPALVADAARLIGFGLNPKVRPTRDGEYTRLLGRYLDEPVFADTARSICQGLDLVVLEADPHLGLVLGSIAGSLFQVRMSDYTRRDRAQDKILHGLAHLGIAAMAYPRPADLADPTYVGRVSAAAVEAFIREAARRLGEQAASAGIDTDPPADAPDLEAAWRVYARRAADTSTKDGRFASTSTHGIVSRALNYLEENRLLTRAGDDVYKTTGRYRVQVREAGSRMFDELLRLGITEISDGSGSLVTLEWTEPDLTLL